MPKITFTEGQTVYNPVGDDEVYEAGKTYDLPEASCDRWVRRGVAEHGEPEKAAPAKPATRKKAAAKAAEADDTGGED